MVEQLILVDENDNQIGSMEKLETHKKGLLHRAFSGFIFNDKKELLLQQRASCKYHNPNIWSNTVCSHPNVDETTYNAIKRRIFEEFGFDSDFKEVGTLTYKIEFKNGLTENEFDHIFVAKYNNQVINPNKNEIQNYKWINKQDLEKEITKNPENYSYWLRQILKMNNLFNEYF